MMNTSLLRPNRTQRRSRTERAQRQHSFSRSWRRQATAALLMGLLPLGQPHTAHAQTVNTWNGTNGDWNTAANWSLGVVPNGSGGVFFAVVNPAGGSDNLTHSSSTGPGGVDTIYSFVNAGLFNLTGGILAGSRANAASTFINNGTVNINGGTLRNFTVSGTPLVFSSSGSNFLDSDIFQSNLNLNNGVARILTSLTIQSGSTANVSGGGYLVASDNGTTHAVTLSGPVLFDGNGANKMGIDGGVTLTLAAGSLVHGVNATIGEALYVGGNGTLVNNGTISSDGGGNLSLVTAPVTNAGMLQAKQNTGGTGSTLTLNTAVNNTNGVINVADLSSHVVQNGVSITGGRVTGVNGSLTNNILGGLQASNSGNNFLNGVTFDGGALVTDNGQERFTGALSFINGGIARLNNAYLTASGASGSTDTLSGPVLFDGNGANKLAIDGGVTLTLAAGSLVHGVNATVGEALYVGGTGTLVNNGTISSDGGGNFNLTTAPVTNNATLDARNGSTLTLGTNVVNGTAGVLNVADLTSRIIQNGVAITGGRITGVSGNTANNVLGGLQASNNGSNFLNGVTFDGGALVTDNGQERFTGALSFINGGIARLNNAYLTASDDGTTHADTLSGPVLFDGNGSNKLAIDGGVTLTLAAGTLVHGVNATVGEALYVGGANALVNNATVSSDGGGTFNLNSTTVANAGTLQAKQSIGGAGSTLTLNTSISNTAGGVLNVADLSSHIVQNGVSITGGRVTGVNGSLTNNVLGGLQASNSGNNFLNGVTFDGGALVTDNGQERFTGALSFINGGIARLNNAYLTASGASGSTDTLSGPVLFDGNGANKLGIDGGVTLAIAAGSLVHGGNATIGEALYVGGTGTLVNGGVIKSDGGGTLTFTTANVTNGAAGTIQATGGSVTSNSVLNNAGTVLVSPGSTITTNNGESQTGGVTQIDGTFTANNAPITLTGGTLKGTGTVNGNTPNVVNTSGTVKPGDSPGTLTITGDYSQAPAGHMMIEFTNTAHGLLVVTGGVTLGGVLDISYLGPAKADGTYRINSGDPGSTFDFLTFGTLSNTNLGTLFSNEYTSGGSFFVNGIPADNFGGSPAVYQLTQDGGNALKLTLTTTATPEPSQWAAFGLGGLGLAGLGLRARRRAAPTV